MACLTLSCKPSENWRSHGTQRDARARGEPGVVGEREPGDAREGGQRRRRSPARAGAGGWPQRGGGRRERSARRAAGCPSPGAAATVADAEQDEQRGLPARDGGAERGRRLAVEGGQRQRAVRDGERDAGGEREAAAPRPGRRSEMPSRSPNSSSSSRGGASGSSASIAPTPSSAETATATPTSAPIRSSRAASAIAPGRDQRPARGAEHQRRAGQRGDHEPGQQPVAHRLGGVGLAVQQDPHAQRAEGEREDQDLEQRPAGDGVGEHQCSWCSTAIAVVPSARTTSSPP